MSHLVCILPRKTFKGTVYLVGSFQTECKNELEMLIPNLHILQVMRDLQPHFIPFHFPLRRKNLAVHLGLDDTVSKREVQKINTYRDVARGF